MGIKIDWDFLGGFVIGPVTKFEKEKVKQGLQSLHDENKDEYTAVVLGAYAPVKLLLTKVVARTKTELDDSVVAALVSAIEESASENGLTLPELN